MRYGAPKMGLNEAHGRCPDAPGFSNLFPDFRTGDHQPRKILYPTPFKGQGCSCFKRAHE